MVGIIFSYLKMIALKTKYGKRLEIKKIRQNISYDTEIKVGKDAHLSLADIYSGTNVHLVCEHGKMDMGMGVIFNRNCTVVCRERIKIGNGCLFGPNVCIFDHDHKFGIQGVSPGEFLCSEIVLEDGCWIGAGVIILRGTHIGENTVIGAGAVVKGDIPPYSLVVPSRETKILPLSILKNSGQRSG